ncbi:hypothetical protein [Cerasicoccus maritimus]|uniref:hypothetical protein n=1 Tax=Cerasicoccus maritimus TaxID=490089 RepID=UPI0028528E32|nr:hypothetical protein [Cerasicoccus maritimus]
MVVPDSSCEPIDDWRNELRSLGDFEGVVSHWPGSEPVLFMTLILRGCSQLDALRIGIDFWSICDRMSCHYSVEKLKVRVALAKKNSEGALTVDDFDERICELYGVPGGQPGGHIAWNRMRSKLWIKDGAFYGEPHWLKDKNN